MPTENHLYVHESGREFRTGCEPRKVFGQFPVYGQAADTALISRDEWPELIAGGCGDLSAGLKVILDQTDEPWCWAFSATQALMVARVLHGAEFEILAPDVCPIVTGEFGGNAIDAAVTQVQIPVGQPPADILPGCDPVAGAHVTSTRGFPDDWKTTAAQYRVLDGKWLDCPTFEALVSALLEGHPGVMGVDWQGGGHALCVLLVTCDEDGYYLHGPNSWGLEFDSGWGSDPDRPGWYKLSERQCAALDQFGAYALSAETFSKSDPEPAA